VVERGKEMDREDEIRLIAYQVWEGEGYVHGRQVEHWLRAESIWESRREQQDSRTTEKPVVKKTTRRKKKNTK
jgi:hypothetical protein